MFDGECSYCGEYEYMRRERRKRISDERRAASGRDGGNGGGGGDGGGGGGGGGNGGRIGGRRNSGRGNFASRNKHNLYNRNPNPKNPFKKKGKGDGTNQSANGNGGGAAKDKSIAQSYICHQQGDHDSIGCPNGSVTVKLKNESFEDFQKQNALEDGKDPNKRFRVAVVVLDLGGCYTNSPKLPTQGPEGADNFTVPLKHGQQYVMLAAGI